MEHHEKTPDLENAGHQILSINGNQLVESNPTLQESDVSDNLDNVGDVASKCNAEYEVAVKHTTEVKPAEAGAKKSRKKKTKAKPQSDASDASDGDDDGGKAKPAGNAKAKAKRFNDENDYGFVAMTGKKITVKINLKGHPKYNFVRVKIGQENTVSDLLHVIKHELNAKISAQNLTFKGKSLTPPSSTLLKFGIEAKSDINCSAIDGTPGAANIKWFGPRGLFDNKNSHIYGYGKKK